MGAMTILVGAGESRMHRNCSFCSGSHSYATWNANFTNITIAMGPRSLCTLDLPGSPAGTELAWWSLPFAAGTVTILNHTKMSFDNEWKR